MKKIIYAILMISSLYCGNVFANTAAKTARDVYFSSSNPWKEFFSGKIKYIESQNIKLRTLTMFDNLKAKEGTLIYNPETKAAGINTAFEVMTYNILFDEQARSLIIKAYDEYKKDFDSHSLERKTSKTTKKYGEDKTYVEFGTFKNMMNHYTHTGFSCGYRFFKKTPYFVLSVMEAKDEWDNASESERWVVPTVTLYFTLSQGEQLVQFLSPDNLKVYQDEYDVLKESDIAEELNETKKYDKDDDLDSY